MEATNECEDPSFRRKSLSLLLELASRNDLHAFQQAVEVSDSRFMDMAGHWYCRYHSPARKDPAGSPCRMGVQERTPMMIAASYGSIDVLSYILKSLPRGSHVNRRSGSDGSTALHCAAAGGSSLSAEAVALLVDNGAHLDACDVHGRRPADVIAKFRPGITIRADRLKAELERVLQSAAAATEEMALHVGDSNGPQHSGHNCSPLMGAVCSRCSTCTDNRSHGHIGSGCDADAAPTSSPRPPAVSAAPTRSSKQESSTSTAAMAMAAVTEQSQHHQKPKVVYPIIDPSIPDIKSGIYTSDEFRMFYFKVRLCSRAYSHDWTECPFLHPGENARRRDPRRYHYSCMPCPDFRKAASCKWGDACEYAHGVFECWLHPAQYRTRLCKDGAECTRRVCFFAHTNQQLRPVFASTGSALPCLPTTSSMASTLSLVDIAAMDRLFTSCCDAPFKIVSSFSTTTTNDGDANMAASPSTHNLRSSPVASSSCRLRAAALRARDQRSAMDAVDRGLEFSSTTSNVSYSQHYSSDGNFSDEGLSSAARRLDPAMRSLSRSCVYILDTEV